MLMINCIRRLAEAMTVELRSLTMFSKFVIVTCEDKSKNHIVQNQLDTVTEGVQQPFNMWKIFFCIHRFDSIPDPHVSPKYSYFSICLTSLLCQCLSMILHINFYVEFCLSRIYEAWPVVCTFKYRPWTGSIEPSLQHFKNLSSWAFFRDSVYLYFIIGDSNDFVGLTNVSIK
jgi:hypothetical protein